MTPNETKHTMWVEQEVVFGNRERRMAVYTDRGWRDTKYFMRLKPSQTLWTLYAAGMSPSGTAMEIGSYKKYENAQLDAELMARKEGGACPIR